MLARGGQRGGSLFGLLMTFLRPLLAFSSWMWLDCIAQTSLGMLLEEECLCWWILTLQTGNWGIAPWSAPERSVVQAWFGVGGAYLYLWTSRAFCLLLHTACLFSGFLDQRNWFVHDWRIVRMCWWGADGADCWIPGGRRALRRVDRGRCRRLYTAPAQRTLPPTTFQHGGGQDLNILIDLINRHLKVEGTNLSSGVRPRSWLRLRLIGYTLLTRVRSLVMWRNLSSLLRWDWPGWQDNKADDE